MLYWRLASLQLNEFIIFIIPLAWNFSPGQDLVSVTLMNTSLNIILQDCMNPLCTCSLEIEYLSHFFLHCHYFTNIYSTLLSELQSADVNVTKFSDNELTQELFCLKPDWVLRRWFFYHKLKTNIKTELFKRYAACW